MLNSYTRPHSSSSIFLKEGEFIVKTIVSTIEKLHAYQLRHRVFAQELAWVVETESKVEMDDYDYSAIFFGVFDKQEKLLAFLRLIPSGTSFMLENDFLSLVDPEHKIRKEADTVEVSRLCVVPEARNDVISGNFGVHSITMLLYKGIYHWCMKNYVRYLYLVVEHKIYRLLCARGFPCQLLGKPALMPDGVVAVAAIMDWRVFEQINETKRQEMLKWFTQYPVPQDQWLPPQPGAYLQHQVFA